MALSMPLVLAGEWLRAALAAVYNTLNLLLASTNMSAKDEA